MVFCRESVVDRKISTKHHFEPLPAALLRDCHRKAAAGDIASSCTRFAKHLSERLEVQRRFYRTLYDL